MKESLTIVLGFYPTLFYNKGGLQNQILAIKFELEKLGHKVFYFYEYYQKSFDIDIYHHFGLVPESYGIWKHFSKISKKTILSPVFNYNVSHARKIGIKLLNRLLPFSILGYKEKLSIVKDSDFYIFLGEKEKTICCNFFNVKIPSNKYLNLPNGVGIKKAEGKIKKSNYILHIGSIYPLKNQVLSIRIAKRLKLKLLIIGDIRDPQYYEICKKESEGGHIEFLGYIENLSLQFREILASAGLVIVPSYSEVLPLTAIESISLKTPVVCTSECTLQEYVQNLESISFASPNSEKEFLEKVKALIKHDVSNEDVKFVQSTFNWENITKHIISKYYEQVAIKEEKY